MYNNLNFKTKTITVDLNVIQQTDYTTSTVDSLKETVSPDFVAVFL